MQINKYNNTSFTARNYEIRRADNIMRNMLNQYPSRSTTKQRLYPIVQNGLVTVENFMYKTMNLMDKIRNQRIYVKDKNYLNRIISDTAKYKLANCGELTLIAKGAFLANGYKDLTLVNLNLKKKENGRIRYKDLDHCFLLLNSGKDANIYDIDTINKHAIIVDPWMGFVDYLHAGIKKYENVLINTPKASQTRNQNIVFENADLPESMSDTCSKLSKEHPEFIIL